ncbi:MAG: sodium:solute symporter [Flavobacteriales bacterium]|nr:sodium:solute symporter [Flavobacteriales bacterium]MCB9449043.1 sodium:solute symporter [Flavobacteriales bacterium]
MSIWDWAVMLATLLFIVIYGTWKTRGSRNLSDYIRGGKDKGWGIALSVMATQASAITFLSTPGKAYTDGMGFVQFYFGLPLAMVVISAVFIPLYYKLKVYTAYEFLEGRFDVRTRLLTAGLFLVQRGLAAGITIYAPAIILSQILHWDLNITILFIGVLVIIYTVSGGTSAVSQTHKQQMAVIFAGMLIAFVLLVQYLGEYLSFPTALSLAGKLGKMEVINLDLDPDNRYTLWSGLLGGFFLQLSYFGTDQSQVQRYLSGRSVTESRLGLMFNAILKIPMQFFILLIGVLVFVCYQLHEPPLHFNKQNEEAVLESASAAPYRELQADFSELHEDKKTDVLNLVLQLEEGREHPNVDRVQQDLAQEEVLRARADSLILSVNPTAEVRDNDYIFITWVLSFLPVGLVGLLLAVIFSAAMSSTSAELNALGSTGTVDVYKRKIRRDADDGHYLKASRWITFLFGVLSIIFAILASLFDNLIEAVNILGSLFYGSILGIFLVAFFFKGVGGRAVFPAALISQGLILVLFYLNRTGQMEIAYLWYNLIAPALVIGISLLLERGMKIIRN